ncbi:putative late blight resistance protein homolog R1B-23 [Salvia hispanica]|uniref:putative late blight resistance protein homolog R1B-23 n=1 Tax=Salvia hispanica TaxID=49212 RepID=UPI0020099F86|nr:putative late blight resistance protein homolog R1B-23 [Salvia hispanica]
MEDVGVFASCPRQPNKLHFFTETENWELLRWEALLKLDCPPELEIVGQLIARDCEGLPLAIVVIEGILAAKFSAKDSTEVRKAWEKVSMRVNTYLSENDSANRMKKFISLSYDR